MDAEKLAKSATTDGQPPEAGFENAAAPSPIDPETGQHKSYWVLSPEERAKGFVRPVRQSYKHIGPQGPQYPLRDLDDEEHARYDQYGYVQYEAYPAGHPSGCLGQYWTQDRLDRASKPCGAITKMGLAIAETYARDPKYYGATFCCACGQHLPVAEFVWDDAEGARLGT